MPIKANNCLYIYLGFKKKKKVWKNVIIAREKERARILIKPNET